MKKLAALAGAGAMLLGMATPVFGCWWCGWGDDVTISNYKTSVKTKVYTKADTGDNEIHGKYVHGGLISTGIANASVAVLNDVNSSDIYCSTCDVDDVDISNDRTRVRTKVYTKADSGDNEIGGKCVHGGTIYTGAAGASSVINQFVNYSSVGLYN